MTLATSLPSIYNAKVNLWVEDALVREYLSECWRADPDIRFLIAGGNDTVWGAVRDAERHGHESVFGFSDRDFRRSNAAKWSNAPSGPRVLVPQVHEVENYLLDPQALQGCSANTAKRTLTEIESRLRDRAKELVWWMACRSVIASIRDDAIGDFIGHPVCPAVTDLATARLAITQSVWFSNIGTRMGRWLSPGAVDSELSTAHAVMQGFLSNSRWLVEFSGKELFRHIRGWLYPRPPSGASPVEADIDVARMVAQWQTANRAVPSEVQELRLALRARVGI